MLKGLRKGEGEGTVAGCVRLYLAVTAASTAKNGRDDDVRPVDLPSAFSKIDRNDFVDDKNIERGKNV